MGVETTHPQYDAHAYEWQVMRDTSAGEQSVKAAGEAYLPKLGGQDGNQYDAYKTRASYYNATGRTIDGLTGMIFRQPPLVEHPEAMGGFMERPEERRVGRECVSTCRSRWSADHEKKKR